MEKRDELVNFFDMGQVDKHGKYWGSQQLWGDRKKLHFQPFSIGFRRICMVGKRS